MKGLNARSFTSTMLAAFIACCAVVAQSQSRESIVDTAVPVDAPAVSQMIVDSDGRLHFGPRTVPLPALASPEARRAYTRQMLQRAQTSAARGGLASARITDANAARATGGSKETALKIYPVEVDESQKIGGVGVTILFTQNDPIAKSQQGSDGVRNGRRGDRRRQPRTIESDQGQLSRRRAFDSGQ